jgi:hypothetical protein
MQILIPIALFGFIPFALLLFALLPPRRAVITTFILAWLFLPMAGWKVPGIPSYDKTTATCVGVFLGVLIFDINRLLAFRPSLLDLPVLVLSLSPFATSIANGLGAHDGVTSALGATIMWFLPYFIGRLYFRTLSDFHELAVGIFIGGLIYVPLCLYEIRMSPQLHRIIYGYFPHSFVQTKRWGGYRPSVFMQHGLMVGMWMAMASLVGIWLWSAKLLKPLWGISPAILVGILLITSILCKSTGAIVLLAFGLAAIFLMRRLRSPIPLMLLAFLPPVYMVTRATGVLSGTTLVNIAEPVLGMDRSQSFAFRLKNEDSLAERAMQQKWLGWGGWNRSHVIDDSGRDSSISDGMWIIEFGQCGIVGLAAFTLSMLLPPLIVLRRFPARYWGTPALAPAAALAIMLVLYMADCLMNAMINPIYLLAAGGLAALRPGKRANRRVARVSQASAQLSGQRRQSPAYRMAKGSA